MRNLGRPLLRLLGRDDRGAIGVLVAVLIGGGVLLGMGALAIDVGQIYQNRAELQNGADSAALAIARSCAQGTCPANPSTAAGTYAIANASPLTQGAAGVNVVCGSDSLGSCASVTGTGMSNCPADPTDPTVHFVDVRTETQLGDGTHLLPPVFAETLVGKSTYNGTTVMACAQAEWGPPGGIAFTVSSCEWAIATGGTANPVQPGSLFWDPKSGTPPYTYDRQFLIHGTSKGKDDNSDGCQDGPANQDAPGAFGWTEDDTGACHTIVTSNNTYGPTNGNPSNKTCVDALNRARTSGSPVFIPVYSQVSLSGNNTTYLLDGFASFVVTGFHVSGTTVPDWLNPNFPLCSEPDTCIDGYLTTNTLSKFGGGNPDFANIKLTG